MMGKGDPPEMLKKFGMAMTLGTVFISYILAGGLIGYFLDKWLGTSPWMFLLFFFLGMGGAIYKVFKLAAKLN
ncbi:MAG: AtpZ/AtpI family protein [Acidobacteria bacterium]|nr:AtpZ/AtpI family protein [Acidobacteriota bacterium]